eukprot:TRINITY_DN5022_c0_g1_i2.p2 TRINITY_DN5022_c0_g1~~TRINITY_DN5022_c0_g1_i2.p2  ORF type:complete len:335 (-),score=68.70 TRINITY_DN5022_c0_g1_i2:1866-2870(-)
MSYLKVQLPPARFPVSSSLPPAASLERNADERVYHSACIVQRFFQRTVQRSVFRKLTVALVKAEGCITAEVLRKISPREASLLQDPTLEARLRFRFGGETFPPRIYFKVFCKCKTKYITGKEHISGGSKAAEDACYLMGKRSMLEIVTMDECVAEMDGLVVDHRDYWRFQATVDSRSAAFGGRNNMWRELFDDHLTYNQNLVRLQLSDEPLPYPWLMDRLVQQNTGWLDAAARIALFTKSLPMGMSGPGDTTNSRRRGGAKQRERAAKMAALYRATISGVEDATETLMAEKKAAHMQRMAMAEVGAASALMSNMADDDDVDSLLQWSQALPSMV